ncbi:MAG: hypothetical protein ACE5FA_00020 [Dehalococcoidia bacterium]
MPTVFFTDEILDRAKTLLKTGMTFTPKIVQKADLMFWPEGAIAALTAKVPAIFIKPVEADVVETDATATRWETVTRLRVIAVDRFSAPTEDVVKKRIDRCEDIADRFLSGTKLDMGGATIAGFAWFQAKPVRLIYEPAEDGLVSLAQDRDLFAVAIEVIVRGEADR